MSVRIGEIIQSWMHITPHTDAEFFLPPVGVHDGGVNYGAWLATSHWFCLC